MTGRFLTGREKSRPWPWPANAEERRPTVATPENVEGFRGYQWSHLAATGFLQILLVALLLLGCLPSVVEAVTTPSGIEVEVGVGGTPRAGFVTPVSLRLSAGSQLLGDGQVAVAAEDPDGQWVQSPPVRLSAVADGGKAARLLVKLGRRGGDLRIVTLAATAAPPDDPANQQPAVVEKISLDSVFESTQELLLVLGSLTNADRATRLAAQEDGSRARVVILEPNAPTTSGALPASCGPAGLTYDAIDRVIVCGQAVAAGGFEQQLTDLDEWVQLGGELVLVAGMSLPEMVAASPIAASWLPGHFDRLVPLRRAAAIETYARASRPLDRDVVDALRVPLFKAEPALNGMVEVAAGGSASDPALVVRRAHGFGCITWVGLDLDSRPFQNWPGTDSLLLELLNRGRPSGSSGRAGEARRGGLDLTGQLRLAIDRYPDVAAIPFELIALIGLLYVAALYPFDWWLASRDARRSWVAWISLPLIVAGFTVVGWQTAKRYRATTAKTQTTAVIDVDQAGGFARSLGFAGVWAAENDQFTITAAATGPVQANPAETAISWFAAPGRSLGGPDALTPHPSLAAADYRFSRSAATLEQVPQAAASSRLFEALWCGPATAEPIRSTLDRTGQGTLSGGLQNRLDVTLDDCVLVHGGWLYDVGRLGPGDQFDLESGRGPRSLAAALTRRQTVKDRSVPARWNADDRDIDRIIEVAGLYAAAGGAGYTGLELGRLGRFDLSRLLGLERAILIGRGPAAISWQVRPDQQAKPIDAGVNTTTLWRVVLPVAD